MAEKQGRKPLVLKIAPDVDEFALDDIVRVARARGMDGLIVSNTTLSRPDTLIDRRQAGEAGGLSGRPVFNLSTRVLAQAYLRVENQFPLIGVGGIDGPETAFAKIEAGATLLQLYSAMVFRGPGLPGEVTRGLVSIARGRGLACVEQARGTRADDWASGRVSRV